MLTREEKIKAIYEEIGEGNNPVMIGDVLDCIEPIRNKCWTCFVSDINISYWENMWCWDSDCGGYLTIEEKLLRCWREKRNPLEEQDNSCIDYIYSLLQK